MKRDTFTALFRGRVLRAEPVLGWLLVAAPFLLMLVALPRFGELQRNDYWYDFRDVLEPDYSLTSDPSRWLTARSNEHRIGALLPIWLLNAALTHGDNRGLAVLSLVLLIFIFATLYRRLPRAVRDDPVGRALHAVPLAALVASPAGAHSWVMGFSGNQWFLANALAVGAIAALVRPEQRRLRDLCIPGSLVLLAAFVHSTYLGIALVLLVGTLTLESSRRARVAVTGLAALVAIVFLLLYRRPAHHAPPTFEPLRIATFVCEYVGGTVSPAVPSARVAGAFALVAGALALWRVRSLPSARTRRAAGFWLLLSLYGLSAAFGTAIGRGHFEGSISANTSRYAALQNFVWIGIGMTWALLLRSGAARLRRARMAQIALVAVAASVCLANCVIGLARLRGHVLGVRVQPAAALAMRWGIDDPATLASVSPFIPWPQLEFFRRLDHSPFDRAPEGLLGRIVDTARLPPNQAPIVGLWLGSEPITSRFVRVRGTLDANGPRGSFVLFLDAEHRLRGAAFPIADPAVIRLLFGLPVPRGNWLGYLESAAAHDVRPFLSVPGHGILAPLAVSTTTNTGR